MPNHEAIDEPVSVALLYQTTKLEGHLKDALNDLGAAVVYEALTAEMDRDALEGSGAHVVIVNLDPDIESHLDEVYDLLDDARYNVVFNDAQVSSGLSGWEQARWSRHLAAKIMGRPEVSDPPRPVGSEAPPSPAQKNARAIPDAPYSPPPSNVFVADAASQALFAGDGSMDDALGALFAQHVSPSAPAAKPTPAASSYAPSLQEPAAAPAAPAAASDNSFGFDLDSLLGDIPTAAVKSSPPPARVSAEDFEMDFAAPGEPVKPAQAFSSEMDSFGSDFDLNTESSESIVMSGAGLTFDSDFDLDLGAIQPPKPAAREDVRSAAQVASDFGFGESDFGTDAFTHDAPAAAKPATPVPGTTVESFDFAGDLDSLFAAPEPPREAAPPAAVASEAEDFTFDFDAAFGGALQPAAETPKPVVEAPAATPVATKPSVMDWSLAPLAEEADDTAAATPAPVAPVAAKVEKMSAESFLSQGNWSLEEISDDSSAAPVKPAADFGVEKVAVQEYLAPEGGDASKFDFDTSLKLDLIPMEEAVAPVEARASAVVEHRLDGVSAPRVIGIKRVVVLGASIGGPEAVREYLANLPARFPALFVLAQHMGAEFLELMAAQLAKATPLTVCSPAHGSRASHGEVLVVPTTHRLLVDPDGVVQLTQLPEASPYTPSIDLVVRDIADRFGKSATVIIFSGMAHDAIDGSKHLAQKGGTVWVQDPDTCVISSMVDGAREAGIVSFTGSPAELAKHTIATLGNA